MSQPIQVMLLPQSGYHLEELISKIELIFETFHENLPDQGSSVLLKPNLVKATPRSVAAQTDPEFMRAMILCCQNKGWKVTVGDSPAIGSARQVGKASGLTTVCDELKVNLITLDGATTHNIDSRTTSIASNIKKFDAVINCPKLKGHGQLYYTGAVKNLYGCVGGKRKVVRHITMGDKNDGQIFAQMLLDVAKAVKPCLTIVDGIDAMAGRGPLHGKCVSENILVASSNPIALDWHLIHHLKGDISKDPVSNLIQNNPAYENDIKTVALTPEGLPKLGNFYFPGDEERKPISFHPWVILRFIYRNFKQKLSA